MKITRRSERVSGNFLAARNEMRLDRTKKKKKKLRSGETRGTIYYIVATCIRSRGM